MSIRRAALVVLASSIVIGIDAGVYAQSISECQAIIAALKFNTQSVAISGKNADRDRAGLIAKLDEAASKLDAAKFCDTIQKLNDFETKVQQLAASGHLAFEDADRLRANADAAIECTLKAAASAGISCAG